MNVFSRVSRRVVVLLGCLLAASSCAPSSGAPADAWSVAEVPAERFVVIGDWGTGLASSDRVASKLCRWREDHPFDLVITTGDNIYPDGAPEHFEANFFDPFACLLDAGVQFRATLGNHDVVTDNGQPELDEDRFGMPWRNYVLRASGVRFVMANSNNVRRKWLRRKTKPVEGDEWTVVVFHHPVYSPGEHGSTPGFAEWMPDLFERRGVDLVVSGHDHLYSVTKPLERIRYVVTGGGGASLYDCSEAWFVDTCKKRHHFVYVVVTDDELRVRAVPAKGKVFDKFRSAGR